MVTLIASWHKKEDAFNSKDRAGCCKPESVSLSLYLLVKFILGTVVWGGGEC